ncbi:hypothetical protein [Celeribacter arenosi]|uniref:Uncharacterized protein n=1 Tax=Celeribacter arenosi TaxID=792649 RepID=A0ABP7K5V0_9RHOB
MRWLAILISVIGAAAMADPPEIRAVDATMSEGTWRFDVTLLHPDSGWDHYADAWEVRTPDGTLIGTRTLAHPHVNEQPFTRSLGALKIPAGLDEVIIRAQCSVDGWSAHETRVPLKN